MDLRRPLESRFIRTSIGVSPRVALRALVPTLDIVSLTAAVIATGALEPLSLMYIATVFVLLNAPSARARRIDPRIGDDVSWILGRVFLPLIVVVPFTLTDPGLSRFVAAAGAAALGVLVGRGVAYSISRAVKQRQLIGDRTLIVGAGAVGAELGEIIRVHPEFGLRLVGFLDHSPGRGDDPAPLLGAPADLTQIVRDYAIDRVIVAFGDVKEDSIVPVLRSSAHLGIDVHLVPRFFELSALPAGAVADDLWGIPVVPLLDPTMRTSVRRVKRAMDVTVSGLALVFAGPMLAAAALAVRLSSPGPVLFRQWRVGRDGRQFQILKFRTMFVTDDSDTRWNAHGDDHITPVGRILRRASIDELPQLVNVLRGDMSLVGPRPERPHYVSRFSESVTGYADRHRVDVGITGWAQIHGRSRDLEAIPERARFDNYYIEHWSLWRDLVIIARTARTILGTRG